MNKLAGIAGLIPGGGARRHRAVVVSDGAGGLAVNVGGNVIPCSFLDPLIATIGDAVNVELFHGPQGQAEAVVTGRLIDTARPGTGTVKTVPVGSNTITVTGTDGVDYTAYFLGSYTPTVGNIVMLTWQAGNPIVTGKLNVTPKPVSSNTQPVAPPPAPAATGYNTYAATDSGSYSGGLWESYRGGGGAVYQGGASYGGPANGAWFYGGSPSQLAGRTITAIKLDLPPRLAVGNYTAPVTVHLYAHDSTNRPSGDVSRVLGPYDITVPAGGGALTYDIPAAWGATIVGGGGVAIYGEAHAGFPGRLQVPSSGKIRMYWSR